MSENPLSGNAAVLKKINRTRLLNNLWNNRACSRTSLAETTGLDKKTITNLCNSLYSDGFIRIQDAESRGKGRPPQTISLNPDAACSIGIDVGGGHVSAVLMDFAGNILDSFTRKDTFFRNDSVMETVKESVTALLRSPTGNLSRIQGIGICIPGLLNCEKGIVIRSVNLKELEGIPVVEELSGEFGLPVFLEEASRSMALAEIWFGGRYGSDDFIVADLGVGIGLGIVHQGKLYRGAHESSGELGHIVVQPEGRTCSCGKRGCLETVASGKAIYEASIMVSGEKNRERELFIQKAGSYAGMALANVINILDPDEIILQGGLTELGETFLKPLKESAVMHSLAGKELLPRIRLSELKDNAGAMGAGILPLRSFFEMENIRFQ